MLKPVTSNKNCEEDADHLLVTVLEKSSKACITSGARAASIAAAFVTKQALGSGIGDEEWLSEGNK